MGGVKAIIGRLRCSRNRLGSYGNGKLLIFGLILIGLMVIFSYGMGNVSAASDGSIYVNSSSGNDDYNGLNSTWIGGLNGPKATIKNATGTVTTNGTLYIARGTYSESNIQIDTDMKIIGENQHNTVINGMESGNSIFTVAFGVNLTIINLTLTNATAKYGAIDNNGNLTVGNSTFTNNNASSGAGAISNFGSLIVDNGTFTNNTSTSDGGALDSNGPMTVNNCTFTNNSAKYGGAIDNHGTLTVDNSTFAHNNAPYGGAIASYRTLTVNNCTFTYNSASTGGAINNYLTLTVENSTFTNNTSDHEGGAISNYGTTVVNFNRIIGNMAPAGSDIYNSEGTIEASDNWWGTNIGPSVTCLSGIIVKSWLILNVTAIPITIPNNSISIITANLLYTNLGTLSGGYVPNGTPVNFRSTLGKINPSYTTNGIAQSILYSGSIAGTDLVSVIVDHQIITISEIIKDTIQPTAKTNVNGGLYNTTKVVTLSMSEKGKIYYTINKTTPTSKGMLYTKPITISSTSTLKYFAIDLAGNKSPIYTQTYTIDKVPPKVAVTTPANKKINVSRTSIISIKFSEAIKNSTKYNKITIKNLTTGKYLKLSKIIKGNTLSIKTSPKTKKTWYTVTIPKSAIKDNAGNNLLASYTFKFKTGT
jgi:predicted outer membrane repeat protein